MRDMGEISTKVNVLGSATLAQANVPLTPFSLHLPCPARRGQASLPDQTLRWPWTQGPLLALPSRLL